MNLKKKTLALAGAAIFTFGLGAPALADSSTGSVAVTNTGTITATFSNSTFTFDPASVTGLAADTVTGENILTIHNDEEKANFTVTVSSTGVFVAGSAGTDFTVTSGFTATGATLTNGGVDWLPVTTPVSVLSGGSSVLEGSDMAATDGEMDVAFSLTVPAGTDAGDYTNTLTVSADFT